MTGAIDWSLLQVPNIGQAFQQGYDQGKQRNALAAYAENPDNPQALNALIATSPEIGFKAAEHQRRMAEYQREADARGAMADYVTDQYTGRRQRNALAPVQQSGPPPVSPMHSIAPNGASAPAGGPVAVHPGSASGAASQPPPAQSAQPDLSFLGQPQSAADHKFMRLIRLDPKAALQIDSSFRDNMVKRLDTEHKLMDFAASALAGVTDEASYQAAVGEADRRMPEANVRAHVPANYPGPQAIADLRMRSLSAKEQIGALLSASNVAADNARSDRNTDSMIATREGRLAETRRYHDRTDSTRRRGQDLRGSSKGGGRANIPTVATPAEAMKLAPGTKFRTPDGTIRVRP